MLKIFTDTDTDITLEEAKKYGYQLISMPYVIDGEEIKPYEDFEVFDYENYEFPATDMEYFNKYKDMKPAGDEGVIIE